MSDSDAPPRRPWLRWLAVAVAAAGLLVVLRALVTQWGGVVHGHPAYAALLALTAVGCVVVISGSEDGLATTDKIEASRADLPSDAEFLVIEGGSHAQFGSYGLQPGDGMAQISNEDAREQITAASVEFVDAISR